MQFLRDIQKTAGVIPAADFRNIFRCIVPNVPAALESNLVSAIQTNNADFIDYHKLCDIINLYQYHFYRVKYARMPCKPEIGSKYGRRYPRRRARPGRSMRTPLTRSWTTSGADCPRST